MKEAEEHQKFKKSKHAKKVYKHFETQPERKSEKKKALKEEALSAKEESRAQIALQQASSQDEIDQAKKVIKDS